MTNKLIIIFLTAISLLILVSCSQATSDISHNNISQDSMPSESINQNNTINQKAATNQVDVNNQQQPSNQNNSAYSNVSPFFLPYQEGTKVSDMVTDAAGGVHVTYQSQWAVGDVTPIYYAYCPADCAVPGNWTAAIVGDVGLGTAAVIAVTSTGQPRLLWYYQQKTNGGGTYIYAACDDNCLQPSHWTWLPVTSTKSNSQRNLALSPEGNPRFLYTDTDSLHKGLFYIFCDIDCTVPTNWFEVNISPETQFYDINLVADATGKLHMAYNFGNGTLEYIQCGSECGNVANWQRIQLYPIGVDAHLALSVTNSNQPRLAFYSGAEDRQTYYAWCSTDCAMNQGNWQNWSVGLNTFEGAQLDLALTDQNQPHIVYYAQDLALGHVACRANCETTQPVWENRYIETAAELNNTEPPPTGCSLQSWNVGEAPSIAIDFKGTPLVSYDATQLLGGCGDLRQVRFTVIEAKS